MRRLLISSAILVALCLGLSGVASADSATLQINGGAGDPNLVFLDSFNVIQNQGGAGTITDLVIFLSVPTGLAAPSGLTSSFGTVGAISLVGNLANSTSCNGNGKDVYSCSGIAGTNQSNSLGNFNAAELAALGFTAASYDIYEVTISGADLAAKGVITVGGNLGMGTFIDAYGTDGSSFFDTPFTEAGLSVPEPATLTLLGFGFLGLPFLRRKK